VDQQTVIHRRDVEPWKITLIDTGEHTMTGGRLKRVRPHLGEEPFYMTYGDGVADIDIRGLTEFHEGHGADATLTAVQPACRFGALKTDGDVVRGFQEKPSGDGGWINGGFFVLHPRAIDRVAGDATVWEQEPLEGLAADGQLRAYHHKGFWQAMDTLRDKRHLDDLYGKGKAPWKYGKAESQYGCAQRVTPVLVPRLELCEFELDRTANFRESRTLIDGLRECIMRVSAANYVHSTCNTGCQKAFTRNRCDMQRGNKVHFLCAESVRVRKNAE